ncbi:MAG: DUF4345 domain-containing protein [Bacteroidales bacterium]|nr:DUF4345 domain-containing protein [Bacteroidales bacterium]
MEIINIVVLSLSGLLLTYAGSMRLIKPLKSLCLKTYLDNPNIKLEGKVDVFNEMRAAGASMAFGGVILFLGILIPQLTLASFVVAIVILLGNAIGRVASLSSDGKPNKQLAQGLFSELILGAANIFCLVMALI